MKYRLFSRKVVRVIALCLFIFTFSSTAKIAENVPKITGVNLVAPVNRTDDSWTGPIRKINAEWVAILPYGFSAAGKTFVKYNMSGQWWGETLEGMTENIRQAHKNGLKVMLKPMVWFHGSWPGDFELDSEQKWSEWESNYSKYILDAAVIAEKEKVELFCIGTEYKKAVVLRPEYWRELITKIRNVFSGKLTYASNWDNFQKVTFWDELDYIGIDGYFPLSPKKTPSVSELKKFWEGPSTILDHISRLYGRQILFTEFGYRSADACTWKQWELEHIPYDQNVNLRSQQNGYQAFFESLWDNKWFAGVFLWQWYTNHESSGGNRNSD